MEQKRPVEFSDTEKQKLDKYIELLLKWNKSINLIAKSTESEIWRRHILDSAQLTRFIKPSFSSLLDVGSGAGFPAIVIAILRPEIEVTLVESDMKKCAFLASVSRETNARIKIISDRVEKIKPQKFDLITARAFAALDKILHLCASQISPQTELLLLKGEKVEEELAIARKIWEFGSALYPSEIDKSGVVLHIHGVRKLDA